MRLSEEKRNALRALKGEVFSPEDIARANEFERSIRAKQQRVADEIEICYTQQFRQQYRQNRRKRNGKQDSRRPNRSFQEHACSG